MIRENFKTLHIPIQNTSFEYYLDYKKEPVFKPWAQRVPDFVYERDLPYFQMLVPTIDTMRFSALLELLLEQQKPSFFTGMTGVGKSVVIMNLLAKLQTTRDLNPINLNFSAQTSALRT